MRRFLAAAVLSVLLAGSTAVTTPSGADARPLPAAAGCSGVWVVVDYGTLGGIATQCASSFGNGTAALKSAGFSPTVDEGFVLKINGKPSSPDINKAYWSYWHATRNADGSYGDWTYSNLGANSYHPTKGNAEGWRYVSLDAGKVPPGAKPPSNTAPTPSPTKTTTKPTSKPSSKPSASSKPSSTRPTSTATRKPTASASASASASGKATAAANGTASRSASASATTAASSTAPTSEPSDESTAPTESASASAEPVSPQNPGSPTGLIVTAGLVVVAGAGVGGWWWLKGRKP